MKFFVAAALLLFLASCTSDDTIKIITENAEIIVYTEIADTEAEREKGLMDRESLGENNGMLFIFEEPIQPRFWMKNTLIPLDIIFIDKNFIIVDIIENMQPCKEEHCRIYSSDKYAKYALEVNAGFVGEKEVKVGDGVVM